MEKRKENKKSCNNGRVVFGGVMEEIRVKRERGGRLLCVWPSSAKLCVMGLLRKPDTDEAFGLLRGGRRGRLEGTSGPTARQQGNEGGNK